MVLSFTFTHTFKYPFDLVTEAYKSLHDRQNNVSVSEDDSLEEAPSMTCTKRIVTMLNPFPKFFQRIPFLKVERISYFEDVWTQPDERRVWIRTRNLTWEEDISIGSVVYLSPGENNPNWTTWEDITALDFQHCGKFGLILEYYLRRKLESTKTHNIKVMESILEKMVDQELILS